MSRTSDDEDRTGRAGHDDDTQGAQERVEQARERLGETVEQLAAKADVKARTQVKAAEVKGRVSASASHAAHQVQEHTPEQARQAAVQVVGAGRRHPRPLAAVVGAVVAFAVVALARRHARKR
ncbi:DUF3618 domain-containing protein [Streptomyces sp. A5-4]|uniref:DUF3618 domain-containing protein n=1 Tax=Streptomyces sp. A5-4 TaxID=3384771 RepID=UPI003DA8F082